MLLSKKNHPHSISPISSEYQIVEERLYENLFLSGYDCNNVAVMEAYAKEIPNFLVISSKKASKLDKFRKGGLIGCLNSSGLTSKNYKDELYNND